MGCPVAAPTTHGGANDNRYLNAGVHAAKLADVIDKVTAIVKATSDTEAWDELLDTWMDDADIVYDKDLIASVGKDYVKE